MQNAIKLPFQFDAHRMKQELESISDSFQLIKNAYTGNSLLGMHLILPNVNGETFRMTKELQECPYLQEVLHTFQCNKLTYRTQNLKAGGNIERHNDGDKGINSNVVRLNIPVSTNDQVYTYYGGKRVLMKNGECWLPNVVEEHYMENKSDEMRWMLMIDCDLNDWWKNILKDYGFDFESESQYQYYSVEALEEIKSNVIAMGIEETSDLIQEIDTAILEKQ